MWRSLALHNVAIPAFRDSRSMIRLTLVCFGILLAASAEVSYASEREVRFQNDGVVLVGTLTIPTGASKSPALLMIPGSGAVDRNGNGDGLNTDLYRQLAQRLAQLGYVTLRYDKRGVGSSKVSESESLALSHMARDAVAAYQFLRQQPEVDPQRVGVIGYEDGAIIAMALAGELPQPPKVLVCLAAPGRSPAIILRENLQQQWRKRGLTEEQVKRRLEDFDTALVALYRQTPFPSLHEDVAPYFLLPNRQYIQEFYFENPVARLKMVKVPVLLLYGEGDQQVSAKKDGELLLEHARAAGNSAVTLRVLPGTAHLFKHSPAGDTTEVLTNPNIPLTPALVDALKAWLSTNL